MRARKARESDAARPPDGGTKRQQSNSVGDAPQQDVPPRVPIVSLIEPPTPPSVPPSPAGSHGSCADSGEDVQAEGNRDERVYAGAHRHDAHLTCTRHGEAPGGDGNTVTDGRPEDSGGQVGAWQVQGDVSIAQSPRKRPRSPEHPLTHAQSGEVVAGAEVMGRPLKKSLPCSSGEVGRGARNVVGGAGHRLDSADLREEGVAEAVARGIGRDLGQKRVTSPYFSTPGALQRRLGFTQDTTLTSHGSAAHDASQRETQALTTPNSNEREGSFVHNDTHGCVRTPGKDRSPLREGDGRVNPAFLNSFARIPNGSSSGAGITDEQKQRIERNRQAAVEKKMKYMDKQRQRKYGQMRQPDL